MRFSILWFTLLSRLVSLIIATERDRAVDFALNGTALGTKDPGDEHAPSGSHGRPRKKHTKNRHRGGHPLNAATPLTFDPQLTGPENFGDPMPFDNGAEIDRDAFYVWYNNEMARVRAHIKTASSRPGGLKLCVIATDSKKVVKDLSKGAKRLGLTFQLIHKTPPRVRTHTTPDVLQSWRSFFRARPLCDLYVLWGFDMTFHTAAKRSGVHYLVMETPYYAPRIPSVVSKYGRQVADNGYISLGFNGLQGRAVQWKGMGSARWKQEFENQIEVKPWQTSGTHVLILGQYHLDNSLLDIRRRYGTVKAHYQFIVDQVRKWDKHLRPIYFKAHPRETQSPSNIANSIACNHSTSCKPYFVPHSIDKDVSSWDLSQALTDCYVVITINSNAAIKAALWGIPVIVTDPGSLAWSISATSIREINNLPRPDRSGWLNDLAYAQWRREELRENKNVLRQVLLLDKFSKFGRTTWRPAASRESRGDFGIRSFARRVGSYLGM